jgi:citrate lyase subunit beta/citryl-CoA lyase
VTAAATGSDPRTAARQQVSSAVTALFVPGDRPDRFAKASAAGADIVIIDLEDAVAPQSRASALRTVAQALSAAAPDALQALVRVDQTGSPDFTDQTATLTEVAAQGASGLTGLMVAKAEDVGAIRELAARLADATREPLALVPLIETAAGLLASAELARVPGVTRLAFGAIDFALDIGANGGDRYLDHARSTLVVASRAAGIAPPLDSPSTEIGAEDAVRASALTSRNFGFGGKLCIHPAQLAPVRQAFAPTPEELAWAASVVVAEGGAAQVDGHMVDRPVVERAKRILRNASPPHPVPQS